ncbi:TIGR02301 family protein [Chelativorans sp. Marseille-P2723]|uniref:TIGR02301 family protein n=1 Tax=Chelativorans sp. Marseille-P2723 TaxID=2709133 RepID=UPI0015711EAF|nr:TIGR02301 family protein [Chelativorans sp. Marseille-P2723]
MQRLILLSLLAWLSCGPAASQAMEVPYDRQLTRLAEVLGSVHFLRGLCGEDGDSWRRQMEALLEAEAPSEERRTMLVGSFNHGYRSFAAIYTNCTDAALEALDRYMKEGEELAGDIVMRYGN